MVYQNGHQTMGKMMISHWFYGVSPTFRQFSQFFRQAHLHQQGLNVVSMSGSPRTSAHAIELAWNPLKLIFKISYMYYDV
jgi:hypothetical protein